MKNDQDFGEEFVRLALAIDEHMPGYVDAYIGPEEWRVQAKQQGKISLSELSKQTDELATQLSKADGIDAQRKDYLARQLTAMQMTLRLLSGEKVSLADEVQALYDIQPTWKEESNFEEAHKLLDDVLPGNGSLRERMTTWKQSLEISVDKVKVLLPHIINKLRVLTREKFGLPDGEGFNVEFVADQPWSAYNWYLGNSKSRIEINTDMPMRISGLPELIAHEAYPGHHTDFCLKEQKLVKNLKYYEFTVNLLYAPSAVMAEGIATTALRTILTEAELEEWFRQELLPLAGMSHIDPKRIFSISHAREKMDGIGGNAAFMMHDQHKSEEEISKYLQRYNFSSDEEARHTIRFISQPHDHSYIFTYHAGHDLLEELFQHGDREHFAKRLMQEPVTPSMVRQWISSSV
ncbi:MAG TPA: hypothetical protein VK909_19700 [Anaerolineales bacterium]|nr:hypothetical protein [Anaerolineales bacterium]